MEKRAIAELAAKVLYLKNPELIDHQKSLFIDYVMTSIDFVDFGYELKALSNQPITLDDLWPVSRMITNPEFFTNGRWTQRGVSWLREIFQNEQLSENATMHQLHAFFSVDFIARRIAAYKEPTKEYANG